MDATQPSLVLESKAPQFKLKSPVIVYVILVNHSNEDLVINARSLVIDRSNNAIPARLGLDLNLTLADPNGNLIRRKLLTTANQGPVTLSASDFVRLKPQSDYARKIDLSIHFQLDKPGLYTVSAKYSNTHTGTEFGHHAWTGDLHSNQIQVELLPVLPA